MIQQSHEKLKQAGKTGRGRVTIIEIVLTIPNHTFSTVRGWKKKRDLRSGFKDLFSFYFNLVYSSFYF